MDQPGTPPSRSSRSVDTIRPAVCFDIERYADPGGLDRFDVGPFAELDTLLLQIVEQHSGKLLVVPRQRAGTLDNRNGGTEPAVGLCQFDADRPGSDDDEVAWQLVDLENRLVRQVGHGGDTRNRRNRRL